MIPQRRHLSGESQFSFVDPAADQEDEFRSWSERIKDNDLKAGAWSRRSTGSYPDNKRVDDEYSDVPSPPLWEKGGGGSPTAGLDEAHPILHQQKQHQQQIRYYHDDKQFCTSARAQVIARYRQEMMELVKDAPESGYELSLRDMVEFPRSTAAPKYEDETATTTGDHQKGGKVKEKKKKEISTYKKGIQRVTSMDTGLLLKMFMPAGKQLQRGRSNKSFGAGAASMATTTSSKVSPKPVVAGGDQGDHKSTPPPDGYWWKKNEFSESSGTGSTGSSSTSSTATTAPGSRDQQSKIRKFIVCYPFFKIHKNRCKKI